MAKRPGKKADDTPTSGRMFIVGGDKGGVGKTTVSRLLIEYFEEMKRPVRAFDTEYPKGSLARFHPKTPVLDVTLVKSQIEIFDSVQETTAPHVIDLRAGTFSRVLETFEDISILEQLREGLLDIYFFHVIGGNYEALAEVADAMQQLPIDRHVVVKSHATDPDFITWTESEVRAEFLRQGGTEISIPRIDELVYETVDNHSVTFRNFIANKTPEGAPANYSLVLRGYCRKWLGDIFAEFSKMPAISTALERNGE